MFSLLVQSSKDYQEVIITLYYADTIPSSILVPSNRIFATIEYIDKNYVIHSYSVTSVVTDHGLNDFFG